MHPIRYDRNYSRRHFLGQLAHGAMAAGVLAPLWPIIAHSGELTGAYPEELLSIEEWSRGKLSAGDYVTADNVDLVRNLLDPIRYEQIATMGRCLKIAATTTDVMRLSPRRYMEATFRNAGRARFDDRRNVVTDRGEPWIGGHPFPEANTGLELFAGLTMSWGRHDAACYPVRQYTVSNDGEITYEYESVWTEMHPVARVTMDPKPWWPKHRDKLRFQSIVFTSPGDIDGTAYLNTWPYDQHLFPDLQGYLPAFRRVRQFPTSQRFEPLVPGSSLYLSDAWTAGDPLHTWGNYRIVDRGPMLAAVSGGWDNTDPNWRHATHGGPRGNTFWDTTVELVPEAIVVEAEPIGFSRAPVSRKRVWFDARTLLPIGMVSFDRRGDLFRSFDGAYALYEAEGKSVMDGTDPYWSWSHVHAFDIQTGQMTRLEQVREVRGGHRMRVDDPELYDRYLTPSSLRRHAG